MTTTKNKPVPKNETLIYCGPNVPSLNLRQFDTFNNGLPKHLSEVVTKNKALNAMFKPISKLVATRNNLNIKGSSDYLLFKQLEGGVILE